MSSVPTPAPDLKRPSAAAPDSPLARPRPQPPAVVLLSGGLDSTTVLALVKSQGFAVHALSFRYGQRHQHELAAAQRIARQAGVVRHAVIDIDLAQFGGSALTADLAVPKDRPASEIADGIPITYVPARNTIFLSLALAYAEVSGAFDIFLGINALDYSGYPDCRPEFLAAFQTLANLATKAGVEGSQRIQIHAPLLHMSKADIVRTGLALGCDYSQTHSCYDPAPDGSACGRCDACQLRLEGFRKNGLADPAPYLSVAA
jgi:7-cyano-7-deazaguanine synthase